MLKFVLNRFKEPSSYAGLAVVAVACGVPQIAADSLVQIGVGLCGLIAFIKPDLVK